MISLPVDNRQEHACGLTVRQQTLNFIEGQGIRANASFRFIRHLKLTRQPLRKGQNLKSEVMRLLSLNVARPRLTMYKGTTINTGIFKEPGPGRVALRTLNFDGDRQSDLSVHGGPYKAVYAYPSEHYGYWRTELPGMDLPWGMFGENLTTEGLAEAALHIGDRLKIGS